MATLMLGLLLTLLAMAGLSLGVLVGRAPLRGGCARTGCDACARCPRRRDADPGEN